MNILLIEDDNKISDFIKEGLEQEGHHVEAVYDGLSGYELAKDRPFDLLILDLMLPKMDGLSVLQALKKEAIKIPVLILSAKHSVEDRIIGLDTGADDYLVKPFSFAELLARINAIYRRKSEVPAEAQLQFQDLFLDRYNRKVVCSGKSLDLQTKEFALLELLMRNKERVLSKNFILDRIWNINFDPQTNVVDVLVCRLRNKIEKSSGRKYIHTIRGIGYALKGE